MNKTGLSYKEAGVDIDAASESVDMIKKWVGMTRRPEVMTEIGSFGGLFALDTSKYKEPVLVSGTDGVGTKLKIAQMTGVSDTVGIDLVAMCVNDILVHGAEPLFFLDYIAVGKLKPERIESMVKGVSQGCMQAGCALIGGETAEMPGLYAEDEYDLAGFAVGVVERSQIIDGSKIEDHDILIALPSSGLHSNGYSLVRKVMEKAGLGLDDELPGLGKTLGQELLTPTRIYVKTILSLLQQVEVKGMAHITGGGIVENLQRVLPSGLGALIDGDKIPVPPVFHLLQDLGGIPSAEMYRTFNMGIGFVLVVAPEKCSGALNHLQDKGEKPIIIGSISARETGVVIK
ncbi:MAG: phosphoribosylformylglycinamidine cyclo-ligase [Syntrophomonadaceae bacterium]|jgi:phosphoribosylformylglycinamidine cyclo-ligase|nr:phosphoribosylformylglycinamidine cyclo-ligase [Syntrophomonadaceae bacterium]